MPDSILNSSRSISYAHAAPSGRVVSLDVLRGLAILLMILSGLLPKTLPNWFDHGYQPHYKPDASGAWQAVPGIERNVATFDPTWSAFTWVDLVFPMFLFAMGAAMPAALSRRWREADAVLPVLGSVALRWAMLIAFSAFVSHLTVGYLKSSNPDTSRLLTIGGFLFAFLFFMRWPDTVPAEVRRAVRGVALLAILIRITAYALRNESPFRWSDCDIIIRVLAATYVAAALLWLLTAHLRWTRLLIAAPIALLAHYQQFTAEPVVLERAIRPAIEATTLSLERLPDVLNFSNWLPGISHLASEHVWARELFNLSPLWSFSWLKYLAVVVPGMIAGDLVLNWSQRRTVIADVSDFSEREPLPRFTLLLTLLVCVGAFIGLRHYGYPLWGLVGPLRTPWLAIVLTVPPLIALGVMTLPRAYGHLWVARHLYIAGAAFTVAGVALACLRVGGSFFEGGISKGPPSTLSYYLLCSGLCLLLLLSLLVWLDFRRWRDPLTSVIEGNGQNALLAYYLAHAVAPAVFGLSIFALFGLPMGDETRSLSDLMRKLLPGTWPGALWALMQTLLIALVVWAASRARLFWRT